MLCVPVTCRRNAYSFRAIRPSVVYPHLRFNPGIKCMLDRTQFADGIGQFNNIAMTAAAGDDHRLMGRGAHAGRSAPTPAAGNHTPPCRSARPAAPDRAGRQRAYGAGMLPDRQAGGGVAVAILGVPGEAGGHHLKFDAVRLQQITLAVRPGPLDKTGSRRLFAMADGAGRGAKGGGGLPLPLPVKTITMPRFVPGRRHPGVNFIFQPLAGVRGSVHHSLGNSWFTSRLGVEGHSRLATTVVTHQPQIDGHNVSGGFSVSADLPSGTRWRAFRCECRRG